MLFDADTQDSMHEQTLRHFISLLSLFAAVVLPAAFASAQPFGKTVVVIYGDGEGDTDATMSAAMQVERELSARRTTLISMHDARDRFIALSRAPQRPSASEIDELGKEARETVQHAAFGRTAAAQRGVRQIMTLAERSLEILNRETATARQLLDACLALVRTSLHAGKREMAIEQAMSCRRMVPDLSPSQSTHPANVVGVLAEADDQLRRMRLGTLHVQNRPARVCSVYLNGRHLGTTPFVLDQASVGDYRVQVECEPNRPGRVHLVQLGDRPAELTVDTFFDESVQTEPRLGLSYASDGLARGHVVDHAQQLGNQVHADDVILVRLSGSAATLLRVQVRNQRLIGATSLALDLTKTLAPEQLKAALDSLSEARFVGVTADQFAPLSVAKPVPSAQIAAPAERAQPSPTPKTKPDAKPMYKRWWLWTAVGVAVVGGITAAAILATRDKDKRTKEDVINVNPNGLADGQQGMRVTW